MSDGVKELIEGLTAEAYGEGYLDPEETVQEVTSDAESVSEADPEAETQADVPVAEEPPVYQTVLDEDLEAELALPEEEPEDDEDEDDENYDPRLAREREKRRELERELEKTRRAQVRSERDRWVAESTKVFPLLPERVRDQLIAEAKSHRGFLRAAKDRHEEFVEVANRARADVLAHLEALKEATVQEARVEAQEAWGRPTVTPGGSVPPRAEAIRRSEEQRRGARNLTDVIKARMSLGGR